MKSLTNRAVAFGDHRVFPVRRSIATMRNILLGFCVFAAGCNGSAPSSPSATTTPADGAAQTEARAATELPFRGTLEASETHEFQPPDMLAAHLVGTGNATQLGQFTAVSDFTINTLTASAVGTITLTAANGDQLSATDTGHAVFNGSVANVTETATITGGTGRFAGATGHFTITRAVDEATHHSSGSFEGTINLNY